MTEVLLGIFVVWGVTVLFATIFESATLILGDDYPLYSPIELKKSTTMNWFGVIVTFTLYSIISPIIFICKAVYWLFHI